LLWGLSNFGHSVRWFSSDISSATNKAIRSRYLLEHRRIPRRCRMGNAGCTGMSAVSSSYGICHSRQVLSYHEQVGMATASAAEANWGRSFANQSVEPKGEIIFPDLYWAMWFCLRQ
jgi:hypothetical protein